MTDALERQCGACGAKVGRPCVELQGAGHGRNHPPMDGFHESRTNPPSAPVKQNKPAMPLAELDGHIHCDDCIDDETKPAALRAYLKRARGPAHGHTSSDPFPTLFATYIGADWLGFTKGDRCRVVMASRMGDVGLTKNLGADSCYTARCFVDQLADFSDAP